MNYSTVKNLLTTIRSMGKTLPELCPIPPTNPPIYSIQSPISFFLPKGTVMDFYSNYFPAFFIALSVKCVSLDAKV